MQLFNQLLEIFILGFIGGAVPGPMLTAAFTEVLNGGFKKSFKVISRALLAESIVALVILLTIFAFNIPQIYFQIISIIGAFFLIWIASGLWKIEKIDGKNKEIFTFGKIFALTVLSGAFWIFWITVCVPKAFALNELISGGKYIYLITFELGWLIMTSILTFIFSRFRPILLKKNMVSAVFKTFALILVFFAFKSVINGVLFIVR